MSKPLDPAALVAQLQEAQVFIDALTARCGMLRRQLNDATVALTELKKAAENDKAPGSLTEGQSAGGDDGGVTQPASAASASSASPPQAPPQEPGPEPR